MKSTGVVRRVDDLGRIVIPKEIRRTLRIRDGEELEIFVDDDLIYLKKFSKIADLGDISRKIVDVVSSCVGKTVLIADRDSFIAGAGSLKKKYLDKLISKDLEDIVIERKNVLEKVLSNIILIEGEEDKYSYSVSPIIVGGDALGIVIILSDSSDIAEFDHNIGGMIAQFLGKYVED